MTKEQREAKNTYNRALMRQKRKNDPSYGKDWQLANPSKIQGYHRKHRYGLEEANYDALLLKQEGKCAICNLKRRLVVDHCHTKNRVRGLLCIPCNVGLGYYEKFKTENKLSILETYLGGINGDTP